MSSCPLASATRVTPAVISSGSVTTEPSSRLRRPRLDFPRNEPRSERDLHRAKENRVAIAQYLGRVNPLSSKTGAVLTAQIFQPRLSFRNYDPCVASRYGRQVDPRLGAWIASDEIFIL